MIRIETPSKRPLSFVFLLLLLCHFYPNLLPAQKTQYFVNGGSEPVLEWNTNEVEIRSLSFEVELPEVAYGYDLVSLDLIMVLGGNERSLTHHFADLTKYSPLQLKTKFPDGILTGEIVGEDGGDLNSIYRRDVLSNFKDEATFYFAVKGHEEVGVEENFNEVRKTWEQSKLYNGGTLLNEITTIKLQQTAGWESRKANMKAKEEKRVKEYKRGRWLYYAGAAALVGVGILLRAGR